MFSNKINSGIDRLKQYEEYYYSDDIDKLKEMVKADAEINDKIQEIEVGFNEL